MKKLPSYYFRINPLRTALTNYSNGGSVTFQIETNYPRRYWLDDSPKILNTMHIPKGGSYELHYENGVMTSVTVTGANTSYSTDYGASSWLFAVELNIINPLTGTRTRKTYQTNMSTPIPFQDYTDEITP